MVIGDVEVGEAGARGLGVFARRRFAVGEFVFRRRYTRVVRVDEIAQLSAEDRRHLCELDFEHSAVLAAPGCYLNHSCEPNAMRHGVKVFAWTPIGAGEEITIDYRLNAFDDTEHWDCACGADTCAGIVTGSFFSMTPERQELLVLHAPAFIQREYRRRARDAGRAR